MPMSIFFSSSFEVMIANSTPALAASWVVITTSVKRVSSAPSVEPGLKPNQPSQRMKIDRPNSGMLWPGIARGLPSGPYLPRRGPRCSSTASAPVAPIRWTAVEPAKSCMPRLLWSQPPPKTQWEPIG